MNIRGPFGPSEVNFPSPHQIGDRTLTLQDDGIAHIGMLPDFVQTLRGLPDGGDDSADRMFRSAEDTLRYWEKVWAKTHGPVAWAAHGVSQVVEPNDRYELTDHLPSWWGTRAPSIQLQESATNPIVFPTVRLRYRRASDGLEGEVTFSALWQTRELPAVNAEDSLEVWMVEGPAWLRMIYW